MPTVHTVADSVTLADKRLLRAYPRIVKELTDTEDKMARQDLDGFLKLLPAAVERFEASNEINANTIEPSVLTAIENLVSSFGSRNAVSVDIDQPGSNSNTELASVETDAGVGEPELPNGSDTSQQETVNSLSRNELQASAGSGGEPGSEQERPRNARVSSRSRLTGRAARKRSQPAPGDSAGDRG